MGIVALMLSDTKYNNLNLSVANTNTSSRRNFDSQSCPNGLRCSQCSRVAAAS